MTWSPAHLAVEQQDLPRLRDLLDGGNDVEDDGRGHWLAAKIMRAWIEQGAALDA